MTLTELIGKRCVIGLSYFDNNGVLLKRSQLCGQVQTTDEEVGISIALMSNLERSPKRAGGGSSIKESEESSPQTPIFVLPPNLAPWFSAPHGNYRDHDTGIEIKDPDFLVTWDIHRTKGSAEEGQHEWWEWLPRTVAPVVSGTEPT